VEGINLIWRGFQRLFGFGISPAPAPQGGAAAANEDDLPEVEYLGIWDILKLVIAASAWLGIVIWVTTNRDILQVKEPQPKEPQQHFHYHYYITGGNNTFLHYLPPAHNAI